MTEFSYIYNNVIAVLQKQKRVKFHSSVLKNKTSNMNLTVIRIFEGVSRCAKRLLDKKTGVLLPGNMQTRGKHSLTRPKAFVINKYQRKEESIGVYGYCLLASNTNR